MPKAKAGKRKSFREWVVSKLFPGHHLRRNPKKHTRKTKAVSVNASTDTQPTKGETQ